MKNYVRILGVMLAAVFVFAACDSSGGDDPPENETTSYVSADKKTVLTLSYPAAAKSSPARKAPAAGQAGDYTLKVDGTTESEGRFQSSGTQLDFTSTTDNKFSAAMNQNSLDFSGSSIPLETSGGTLDNLSMTEDDNDIDDPDDGDDGVVKSIKIIDIPVSIKIAQAGLYTPPETMIAGIRFDDDEENVSNGIVQGELYVFEGQKLLNEKFTKTGSYDVYLEDHTSGRSGGKVYVAKEKKLIDSELTTLSFNDFELLEE